MENNTSKNKRGKRGQGSLSKRTPDGKFHPATSKVQGVFYLTYSVNGKTLKQRLLDDENKPIKSLAKARQKQAEITAPYRNDNVVDQLLVVQSKLKSLEQQKLEDLEAQKYKLKLSEIWPTYIASHNRPQSSEPTLRVYEIHCRKFVEWMKKTYPTISEMREVTYEHAETFADHLKTKKLSPSTYNQYLNALSLFWSVLSKKARLSKNPFAWNKETKTGIQRKSIKAESTQRKKRPLSTEELNKLMKTAKGDYRILFTILVCTGQRLIDGVKLKWSDVDLQKGIITIIPQKTSRRTGKQVYIPILPQLRTELKNIKKKGKYILPKMVELYDRDSGSALSKRIGNIFKEAGISTHKETDLKTKKAIASTGAHSLRHSFVTLARSVGFPDALIMKITGHSSEELVDHYTEFSESLIASLAARIPQNTIGAKKGKFLPAPEETVQVPRKSIESLNGKNWKKFKEEFLVE